LTLAANAKVNGGKSNKAQENSGKRVVNFPGTQGKTKVIQRKRHTLFLQIIAEINSELWPIENSI